MESVYGSNVMEAGAKGDGISDDSEVIQRLLDARPPLVVVPPGTYRIGKTLRIASGTRLMAHAQSVFFFADGAGTDEDSFLLANNGPASDVWVEGGIWDGNNTGNPRGPNTRGSYTGVAINFYGVKRLTLRNMTIRDAESFHVRLCKVSGFLVEHLGFEATRIRPNQDGIHLNGFCDNGVIRDLTARGRGVTADDMVALNADDAWNVAPLFGAEAGPIRNIRIDGLRADSCHSFVRVLSINQPIENIEMTDIEGGCRVSLLNLDGTRDCTADCQLIPPGASPTEGVGAVSGIRIRDVTVHKVRGFARHDDLKALFDIRSNVNDFEIINYRRPKNLDGLPTTPTLLLSDVAGSRCRVEGISQAVAAKLESSAALEVTPMSSISSGEFLRVDADLPAGARFVIPEGGFERLRIDRT